MKCPACKHVFRLTVREYFREPRGRHTCPACGKRFRLLYSASYFLILALATITLSVGPALAVFHFTGNPALALATLFVGAAVLPVPVDIWLDDNWRDSAEL